jgi:hypothetical protein
LVVGLFGWAVDAQSVNEGAVDDLSLPGAEPGSETEPTAGLRGRAGPTFHCDLCARVHRTTEIPVSPPIHIARCQGETRIIDIDGRLHPEFTVLPFA